jgi:HlyD family secretion protein
VIDGLLEVFESISRHRLRALATAFGVFWGIFMLTMLLASGRGLRNGIDSLYAGDSVNSVWIYGNRTVRAFEGIGAGRTIHLTVDDADALVRAVDELEHVSPRRGLAPTIMITRGNITAALPGVAIYPSYGVTTELDSARERERLVKQGAAQREPGTRSTRVVSPIDGTVLAVPVAIGDVIGDTNSYRDGTTVAVVADMSQLLFKGQLEEAHVGKLQLGMLAQVRVGALEGVVAPGKLRWIAPRATVEAAASASASPASGSGNGTIAPLTSNSTGITRFELWVELERPPANARAGYSATAELTLDEAKQVTLVEERALEFKGSEVSAHVLNADGTQSERKLQVGISDGLRIEVKTGLRPGERVALPTDLHP